MSERHDCIHLQQFHHHHHHHRYHYDYRQTHLLSKNHFSAVVVVFDFCHYEQIYFCDNSDGGRSCHFNLVEEYMNSDWVDCNCPLIYLSMIFDYPL